MVTLIRGAQAGASPTRSALLRKIVIGACLFAASLLSVSSASAHPRAAWGYGRPAYAVTARPNYFGYSGRTAFGVYPGLGYGGVYATANPYRATYYRYAPRYYAPNYYPLGFRLAYGLDPSYATYGYRGIGYTSLGYQSPIYPGPVYSNIGYSVGYGVPVTVMYRGRRCCGVCF
ncbi:MAG: hypothetical protein RIS70_2194 [Planctomycetota bacterium]|jgi:hypothetical protein